MKSLIKKNQLMITALAIMIAIAGYLQFAGDGLEEEYLTVADGSVASEAASGGVITENYMADGMEAAQLTDIASLDSEVEVIMEDYLEEDMQVADASDSLLQAEAASDGSLQVAEATPQSGEIPGEAVFTSANGVTVLSEAKLLKEQTRAKNKETLMEIINSSGLTDAQKQEAVDTMVQMTAYAEKEAAAEILLEAKGFSDVVVSVNGDGVDVVVNAAELTDAQRAQIEDIVKRKTEVAAENIVISTVE